MQKGTGKIKISGALLIGSSLFLVGYILYALAVMGSRSVVFSKSGSMVAAMLYIIGYHIYKLIIGILAVRRANTPECRGIMGNGIALIVLSVFWIIIVGAALNTASTSGASRRTSRHVRCR